EQRDLQVRQLEDLAHGDRHGALPADAGDDVRRPRGRERSYHGTSGGRSVALRSDCSRPVASASSPWSGSVTESGGDRGRPMTDRGSPDGLRTRATPPSPVAWPGGSTSAACFTFDLDAEAAVLTVDINSVRRMSPM